MMTPDLTQYAVQRHRDRVQAIGGPFYPTFNYHREIVCRFFLENRCCICMIRLGRDHHTVFEQKYCEACYGEYFLDDIQLRAISGLDMMLRGWQSPTWKKRKAEHVDCAGGQYYRPMVDELLRSKTGLNFDTLIRKKNYEDFVRRQTALSKTQMADGKI